MLLGIAAIASAVVPYSASSANTAAAVAISDAGPARYRLLHINLRYDNPTPKRALSLIGAAQPDIITLNEVSAEWREELKSIETAYPHLLYCDSPTGIGGVAILSRRPFLHPTLARCFDRGSLGIATVNIAGSAVDIAALHLGWPWPFDRRQQMSRISPVLNKLGTTAILAGDLNSAPWSARARQIASAGGLKVLGNVGPTWLFRQVPDFLRRTVGLPIDNLFVKGRVVPLDTRRLPDAGSDHLPVLLEFGLRPNEAKDRDDVMRV
ncbi:endonuclease/exonuclease/phosphatase family protein [Chelativorans sp. Marseille-P2723]|uniref:endonuclease/exonuclease/phosphatase family protein n=1 Tax=Chelativorans sp. Marseille-P2723 TaxID=2709133 RepID=UPI001FF02CB5|nr:endonuclease/exonuclease/phosphatase family protein [Chelativorans sp. Marseille-P2723]